MTPADQIGNALRAYRKERGLSLRQLENLSGVSRAQICRYEGGTHVPLLETLDNLATALGTQSWRILREANRLARGFEGE